jgi:hypothetical protein
VNSTRFFLVIGILAGSTAAALWEHGAVWRIRSETELLSREAVGRHAEVLAAQDQARAARQRIAALNEAIANVGVSDAPLTPALGDARWGTDAAFVDIPKTLLPRLQFVAVDASNELTRETIALLSLTAAQRQGVRDLFTNGAARFEELEREHFQRSDREVSAAGRFDEPKASFVLLAFPEETRALKEEWSRNLAGLVGSMRAELLSNYLARGASSLLMLPAQQRGLNVDFRSAFLPTWLRRGDQEIHLTIAAQDRAGTVIWHFISEGPGTGSGSSAGPAGKIPDPWRSFLSVETVQAALAERR